LSSRSAELDAQNKQRGVLDAQEQQLQADLNAKQEALKVAQTNLEYTRILAPTDGIVGERKVRIGQLVSPGTQVISLVENTIWVQANYKETQLTNVARGDTAEISVDTFPGLVLRGHVEEIAPASGSQFALLPPDNATGNYTKIVQRIPVKIVLEPNSAMADRLRPGMSVIAEIRTTSRRKA
jgi:membrane fusion protein, multidrug efflux system